MKKIIIIPLLLYAALGFTQNLTLDEIITLRKKDIASVEEFLTLKNWIFLESTGATSETMGTAEFAFNKGDFDDKAESFIAFYYSENTDTKRIAIQIHKSEKYNQYLSRIKSFGCKLINSSIEDGAIKKIYQGATTTFIIKTTSIKNDFEATNVKYHIFIIDNFDYELNFTE